MEAQRGSGVQKSRQSSCSRHVLPSNRNPPEWNGRGAARAIHATRVAGVRATMREQNSWDAILLCCGRKTFVDEGTNEKLAGYGGEEEPQSTRTTSVSNCGDKPYQM